jgi:hypothetical protein
VKSSVKLHVGLSFFRALGTLLFLVFVVLVGLDYKGSYLIAAVILGAFVVPLWVREANDQINRRVQERAHVNQMQYHGRALPGPVAQGIAAQGHQPAQLGAPPVINQPPAPPAISGRWREQDQGDSF